MKSYRLFPFIFIGLFWALLFSGCSQRHAISAQNTPDTSNRLVIYTSHKEEVYLPVIQEFEERTGIWVDIVTGGTNELLARIAEEHTAPQADVIFGGGVENLAYYKEYFTPYRSPEADNLQEAFYTKEHIWTPFSALPVVLIYNTKLVEPQQLQSWEDLNSPLFCGKIAFADPAISGSSFTALATRLQIGTQSNAIVIEQLAAAMQHRQLASSGDVLTAVGSGNFLVGITLEETAMKHIAAGSALALVYPTDGTSCVPDGSALVKGAPHSENAKTFLDFTISYDVQQLLSDTAYRRSVRTDIPAPNTLPSLSQIPIIQYDIPWAYSNREQLLSHWNSLFQEDTP